MQNIQYEESYGVQSQWVDTHKEKPVKIKPMFFIDVGHNTVAKADNLPDALDLLEGYPSGTLRAWAPSQEEYAQQRATNKELALNNWGIMSHD